MNVFYRLKYCAVSLARGLFPTVGITIALIGNPPTLLAAPLKQVRIAKVELTDRRVNGRRVACLKQRPILGKAFRKKWFRFTPATLNSLQNKKRSKQATSALLKELKVLCNSALQPNPEPPTLQPDPDPTAPPSDPNGINPTPTPQPPEFPPLQPLPQINPKDLDNSKSGISLSISGTNGIDWAVEDTFHDPSVGDQVIYLRSNLLLSLQHNERNTIMKRSGTVIPALLGIGGIDGIPHNGDEGDIYYKIDRDMQSHLYSSKGSQVIPSYAPKYSTPIQLSSLTYDGNLPVVGTVGDNGAPWGAKPYSTTDRFAYGQLDPHGNECHTLTYWDDDEPLFESIPEDSHRQGASDGHWVYLCVDPITPVLQFNGSNSAQYYTTPLKTYHIPKTWEQTTYLTSGVTLTFANLTNSEPIYFRINGSAWIQFSTPTVPIGSLLQSYSQPALLEFRAGQQGPIAKRTLILNHDYPGPTESHGLLLAKTSNDFEAIKTRLNSVQPFKKSFELASNSYYQGSNTQISDTREGWTDGAGMAQRSLFNAFSTAISGPSERLDHAQLAKTRLLRLARLEPVGNETSISNATPSKDYLSELGQTIQVYADAGVAYDLLAAHFRASDHPEGITPIEELRIRDGLAEIAKTILQFRDNWSYQSGGGDTHWAYGFELALASIALAMPTYKTPYFGVSGGDRQTVNDLNDESGKFFNPLPDQGITWYQAATDPEIDRPGYPNNEAPPRVEFLINDDGYWTGPNYMEGDGDRYAVGPAGNILVGVTYGGLANAEMRTEIVEMSGYESPFSDRAQAVDYMRRVKGDTSRSLAITNYFRRRLISGTRALNWNGTTKQYTLGAPNVVPAILSFNKENDFAGTPSAKALIAGYLSDLNKYYGFENGNYPQSIEDDRKALYNPYALALFASPNEVPDVDLPNAHAPIIKPLNKYVIKPGETLFKEIIAIDLDDDPLTVQVSDLPAGASYNQGSRSITWSPTAQQEGLYMVTVTADDGSHSTSRIFPIIVKANAGSGQLPAQVTGLTASIANGNQAQLNWSPPSGVNVAYYIIYKDGAIRDVINGNLTSYTDSQILPPGSHTRYNVALFASNGGESYSTNTSPSILSVPLE